MKVLAIETSCDETAIAIVEKTATGAYVLHKHSLLSQIDQHKEFGGVFPTVAKREHEKALVPLFLQCLENATDISLEISNEDITSYDIFSKNQDLGQAYTEKLQNKKLVGVDAIAVTAGPGLEPALWTGLTFAKALAIASDLPLMPVNHLHGHLASVLLSPSLSDSYEPLWPAVGLITSGGHTELLALKNWSEIRTIGQTRDDAVGEAYDKTARVFDIPYPGGAELARRAAIARSELQDNKDNEYQLPTPMLDSDNLDFSFSGLKTAARYAHRDNEQLQTSPTEQNKFFAAFEESVAQVLTKKVARALDEHNPQSFIFTGGVANNNFLRERLREVTEARNIDWLAPLPKYSTDNAVMIALSALSLNLTGALSEKQAILQLAAQGSWPL